MDRHPKAETGGTVGFGQSPDGVRWEALPPPKTPGVVQGEIGGVEKIGGKFYMMQGHDFVMRTLIADQPQGPFLPARKNFRLLSGHTYFTRFLRTPTASWSTITQVPPSRPQDSEAGRFTSAR